MNKCGQTCTEFSKKLEQWTSHSSTTKLSLRDRMSVGLWNKEKIRTFRTQVHSCQAIVHFAITSAQLYVIRLYAGDEVLIKSLKDYLGANRKYVESLHAKKLRNNCNLSKTLSKSTSSLQRQSMTKLFSARTNSGAQRMKLRTTTAELSAHWPSKKLKSRHAC